MRCPNCGETPALAEARFCPHCGSALTSGEGDATRELSAPAAGATEPPRSPEGKQSQPQGATGKLPVEDAALPKVEEAGGIARDFSHSVRRAAVAGGWKDLAIAAGFAFLVASTAGALLVLAAKLHLPSLGEGASPIEVVSGVVMAGLGVLGAQLHLGEVTVSALPLGALGFVLWSLVWSVGRYVRQTDVVGPRAGALEGAKVAVPLALLCCLAALIFRVRTDPDPVFIGAWSALFAGALWGFVAGALGGLTAHASPVARLREGLREIEQASRPVYEGLVAGGLMLGLAGVLVAAATLLWLTLGLIGSSDMVGKEVAAAGIYLVAFLPNMIAAVASLSLGGAVDLGARVTAGGGVAGGIQEVSLFDWRGDADTPWPLFLLLLIPLLVTLLAGFAARRRTRVPGHMWWVIGTAAVVFALVAAELASLADARLGAGLVHERGVGVVAPRSWMVLLLASAWGILGGAIGWKVAEAQPERSKL